jgi:NADH:ubiquinone oxidoreductase subunit K
MKVTKSTPPLNECTPTEGRWSKYLGITLITISIVGLIATPSAMRWLILLEGMVGVVGIALLVYARIQFWRGVKKLIK